MNLIFPLIADLLQPYYPIRTLIDLRDLEQPGSRAPVPERQFPLLNMIGLSDSDRRIARVLLQRIPRIQAYQTLHDLTVGRDVELWHYFDREDSNQTNPIFYLVVRSGVTLPYLVSDLKCYRMEWDRYELEQFTICAQRESSILYHLPNIDNYIHSRGYYSYQQWWAMALEYARADLDDLSKTQLAHLANDHPNPELDRGKTYTIAEAAAPLMKQIDEDRETYAEGCPEIAVRSWRDDGDLLTFRAIMPKIVQQHCQSAPKPARSAEYQWR